MKTDDEQIMKEWEIVNESNPNGHNSMCLDRLHLGNFGLEHRIKLAREIQDEIIIKELLLKYVDGYTSELL